MGQHTSTTTAESLPMLLATSPNLLYVLGIPGGCLLLTVVLCYGIYRVLGHFEH